MKNRAVSCRRFAPARVLLPALAAAATALTLAGCPRNAADKGPEPSSPKYREAVTAFYVGLAALQVGDERAEARLTEATKLAPGEPAAWANLGLARLRKGDYEAAARDLEKARSLAPENSRIETLLGLLETRRGRFPEAIAHLRRAVEIDPKNLKALASLAEEVERQGGPEAQTEATRLFDQILEAQPDNLAALLERTRLAAKNGDAQMLQKLISRLNERAASWPPEAKESLSGLQQAASNPRLAATRAVFLSNVLKRVPQYRASLASLRPADNQVGEPLEQLLVLASPSPTPAAPDTGLSFTPHRLPESGLGKWNQVTPAWLTGEGAPVLFVAHGREVRRASAPGLLLPFPGGPGPVPPTANGVLPLDWNYDFKTDLATAGAGGLQLFQQTGNGTFADVTAKTGLPPAVVKGGYNGAWPADIEADGDLDIVLGASKGPALVLRNNGDGTFKVLQPFGGVSGLQNFGWADIDGDGDPDAALIDAANQLHVFSNERSGQFRTPPTPIDVAPGAALTVADMNRDGVLDFVTIVTGGDIIRVSDRSEGEKLETAVIGQAALEGSGTVARLFAADLDNNGAVDLIYSGRSAGGVLLADAQGTLQPLNTPVNAGITAVADMNQDGRIDLLGVSPEGAPQVLRNQGTKSYRWLALRPRAKETEGDQRINSFGIGGEMEIRSGLLVQKQPVAGPVVHFGLGENTAADVMRVVWPNGSVRAEFPDESNKQLAADQTLLAEQRLKGSCPFLYTWDGRQMAFVTDCIWRSPLGLKINAQDTAGVAQTEDWVKIRGDQLKPRNGIYDVRITAELWETHFFDHVSLLAVDHPAGTDIFVDERFAFPQPPLKVYATTPPRPVTRAR